MFAIQIPTVLTLAYFKIGWVKMLFFSDQISNFFSDFSDSIEAKV